MFDGVSTHIASQIGFDFLYLAGSGVSGSYCGEPDLAVITQTEMAEVGMMVAAHTPLPVIADADTGFGGPVSSPHLVRCCLQISRMTPAEILLCLKPSAERRAHDQQVGCCGDCWVSY